MSDDDHLQRSRPWAVRHWRLLLSFSILFTLIASPPIHRIWAIAALRVEMRDRALGKIVDASEPLCYSGAMLPDGTCNRPKLPVQCLSKEFIDPFELWGGLTGAERNALVHQRFKDKRSFEDLLQWFACQGFQMEPLDRLASIQGTIRTKGGYGPFSSGWFPLPPAWADSVSIIVTRQRKLRVDLGTTYE